VNSGVPPGFYLNLLGQRITILGDPGHATPEKNLVSTLWRNLEKNVNQRIDQRLFICSHSGWVKGKAHIENPANVREIPGLAVLSWKCDFLNFRM
jgi:hypothetical protein